MSFREVASAAGYMTDVKSYYKGDLKYNLEKAKVLFCGDTFIRGQKPYDDIFKKLNDVLIREYNERYHQIDRWDRALRMGCIPDEWHQKMALDVLAVTINRKSRSAFEFTDLTISVQDHTHMVTFKVEYAPLQRVVERLLRSNHQPSEHLSYALRYIVETKRITPTFISDIREFLQDNLRQYLHACIVREHELLIKGEE